MSDQKRVAKMLWPRWASWALVGVVLGVVATLAATINDIY